MQAYVLFAYGGKQLAEYMIGIRDAMGVQPDASAISNLVGSIKGVFNIKLLGHARSRWHSRSSLESAANSRR